MLDLSFASLAISEVFPLIMMMSVIDVDASQSKWSTVEETIACYECKTSAHSNCNDPFNGSQNLFPLEPCKGCCVKIVRYYNTSKNNEESIWRTCTAKLEISHSLVHSDVCMGESNGLGHLCICSEDKCNSVPDLFRGQISRGLLSSLALLLWRLILRPGFQ